MLGSFVNSVDERAFGSHRTSDELTGPAALASWLVAHGLVGEGTTASDTELTLALRLREALRWAAAANRGDGDCAPDLADLAAHLPLRASMNPDGQLGLEPATGTATTEALARIVAVAITASVEGTWRRVKMCAAPDCRVIFYDGSKPRTGRWCSMQACGNRHKTRTYRQRIGPR
ncbi:CGNR zinc finger domain-containing protein [Frankia sp. QA3]|uniref:CGNR zinc finger domain-containing protein n=1 Tax=Frankia sp. QA3 TaxID=710111 RepID=UPI000269CE66|nr:CGNR zinc finger domain-containing protein [Frankia sp. QA3]EIV96209.1 Zn-ribbon-like motif-containing protein [Frankia sp. QA3]